MGQREKQFNSAFVLIVSPNCVQKQLLVAELNLVPGWTCLCADSLAKLNISKDLLPGGMVALIDCSQLRPSRILALLKEECKSCLRDHFVALFNLATDSPVEMQAMSLGVRGFFYERTRLPLLKKGIRALQNDELWISRRKLTACMERGARPLNAAMAGSRDAIDGLTGREREVLGLMASGASNAEIAQSLYISMHTVRTHNYNIFKKLKVSNRVEASIWCNLYL